MDRQMAWVMAMCTPTATAPSIMPAATTAIAPQREQEGQWGERRGAGLEREWGEGHQWGLSKGRAMVGASGGQGGEGAPFEGSFGKGNGC